MYDAFKVLESDTLDTIKTKEEIFAKPLLVECGQVIFRGEN